MLRFGKDAIPLVEDVRLRNHRRISTLIACLGIPAAILLAAWIPQGYATTARMPWASSFSSIPDPVAAQTSVSRAFSTPVHAISKAQGITAPASPTFNGRPVRVKTTRWMTVTAYCPLACCCGKSDGITASGKSVYTNGMKLVAAPREFAFGSLVSIPGYHRSQPVPVLDRGGKIKGDRLDVFMPTHAQAKKWGSQRLQVTVWEYAD